MVTKLWKEFISVAKCEKLFCAFQTIDLNLEQNVNITISWMLASCFPPSGRYINYVGAFFIKSKRELPWLHSKLLQKRRNAFHRWLYLNSAMTLKTFRKANHMLLHTYFSCQAYDESPDYPCTITFLLHHLHHMCCIIGRCYSLDMWT